MLIYYQFFKWIIKKLINNMHILYYEYMALIMPSRKEMITAMNFESYGDLPDAYIENMYEFHQKFMNINDKEIILLEFINTLLEKNDAPKLTKLADFINIHRENLVFDIIPQEINSKVLSAFNIDINAKAKVNDKCIENSGAIYVKNMVKSLDNYEFISARKDIMVMSNGTKTKKPMMVYSIAKK